MKAAQAVGWLVVAAFLLGGCGEQVQGNLRLLLVPPHEGRNPNQDPFVLVDRVEIGVVDSTGVFSSFGDSAPNARFGPGLISGDWQGAPFVLGLNSLGRPVAAGFGLPITVSSGIDQTITVPFSQTNTGVARRIPLQDRTLEDPFANRAPSLFIDNRNLESGAIDSPADLTSLVTAIYQANDLLLRVRVLDDQVVAAASDEQIINGDAVRIYLEDIVVTAGADGRFEVPISVTAGEVETVSGGYQVEIVLPLSERFKNRRVPFDVRVYDKDGAETPALATWCFDPRRQGEEPLFDDYGDLILGVDVLDVLEQPGPTSTFPGSDGLVEINGSWNQNGLTLEVNVPDGDVRTQANDDDLTGADRVEVFLDLGNGVPDIVDSIRFVRVTASAGGSKTYAGGWDPNALETIHFGFTGTVTGTTTPEGYKIEVVVPWSDLQLNPQLPQRGWFFGVEIRVVDEDDGWTGTTSWSDSIELAPDDWPELRLFSAE
jgi:cellulose/xylan binding protein with CBM9 domain